MTGLQIALLIPVAGLITLFEVVRYANNKTVMDFYMHRK